MFVAWIIHGVKPTTSSPSGRGQWHLTVELVKPFKMFNRSDLFFRHFERLKRLKRLERFEPSVSAPRLQCVFFCPRSVNPLG